MLEPAWCPPLTKHPSDPGEIFSRCGKLSRGVGEKHKCEKVVRKPTVSTGSILNTMQTHPISSSDFQDVTVLLFKWKFFSQRFSSPTRHRQLQRSHDKVIFHIKSMKHKLSLAHGRDTMGWISRSERPSCIFSQSTHGFTSLNFPSVSVCVCSGKGLFVFPRGPALNWQGVQSVTCLHHHHSSSSSF